MARQQQATARACRRNQEKRDANRRELQDTINRVALELPAAKQRWMPPGVHQADAGPSETDGILTDRRFDELPLSKRTLDDLYALKMVMLSRIQREALPHALAGRDVLGEAPTGSGKTLSFVVPVSLLFPPGNIFQVLELLWRERWTSDDGLGALILTPTRELSQQIFDVFAKFKHHDCSAIACYGGKRLLREQQVIGNISIVIGTPGRIKEHLETTVSLVVDNVRLLVIDEADKLIEFGFLNDVEDIVAALPPATNRQTLFFSATLPVSVRTLALKICKPDPEHISVYMSGAIDDKGASPPNLVQTFCVVNLEDKISVLFSFLCKNYRKKILVFVSSKKQARLIHSAFKSFKTGAKIMEMHSGHDMNKRLETYDEFVSRRAAITLIATDVVGRGIDFPVVDWVVQLDCPPDADTYVHRVGRAARGAYAAGSSVLFLMPSEVAFLKRLEEKRIALKQVKIKEDLAFSISGRMRALCAQNSEVRHLAAKAFQTYLKSQMIMSDKGVFNLAKVLAKKDAFALSLGLPSTPEIDNQQAGEVEAAVFDNQLCPTGGIVRANDSAKDLKKMSKLHRLKEKIAMKKTLRNSQTGGDVPEDIVPADNDDEDVKIFRTRREKRQKKLLEMRSKQREEMMKNTGDVIVDESVLVASHPREAETEIPNLDWRSEPSVIKAIRKQRLVIRADGTAKLKGAAAMIPRTHKFFDDDDQEIDANTFAGVVASMKKRTPSVSSVETDAEVAGGTEREKFVNKLQKRIQRTKEDAKLEKRQRPLNYSKGQNVDEAANVTSDMSEEDFGTRGPPPRKVQRIEDLEAEALAILQGR